MKRYKFYKVLWRDHASSDRWHSMKEAVEFARNSHKSLCESNGYLIYQNDDYLVLAASHNGEEEETEWGELIKIYKTLIVKKTLMEYEEIQKRSNARQRRK